MSCCTALDIACLNPVRLSALLMLNRASLNRLSSPCLLSIHLILPSLFFYSSSPLLSPLSPLSPLSSPLPPLSPRLACLALAASQQWTARRSPALCSAESSSVPSTRASC
eukprot:m.85081 g.85081  ORF g.85081 m.85081 type:complete len:110 (-) comp14413_c0_seq1:2349-2678(-)